MKANKAQVEARTHELVRIILDGALWPLDLCEYVREQEADEGSPWHVAEGGKPLSYSQIRRYAVRAEKVIAESCRASRKRLLRRHLAQRRNLFAKATAAGDYRTALAAVRDEAELLGLYAPKKMEVTGKGGSALRFSVEDAVQAVKELEEAERGGDVQPGAGPGIPEGSPQVP